MYEIYQEASLAITFVLCVYKPKVSAVVVTRGVRHEGVI